MYRRTRLLLFALVVSLLLPFLISPATSVYAKKQYTITITEAQIARYLRAAKPWDIKAIDVNIIDGGIIVTMHTRWEDIPEYSEHYGVLVRDGKIVAEAGVVSFPGLGGMGYEEIKKLVPEAVPYLDRSARNLNRLILRSVAAKAGSRYTVDSIVTGNDVVTITVTR
jgi:hypothetical protein